MGLTNISYFNVLDANNSNKSSQHLSHHTNGDYARLTSYAVDITIVLLYTELFACLILNSVALLSIVLTKVIMPIHVLILNLMIVDCMYASTIPFYVRQFKEFKGEKVHQTTIGCQMSFFCDVTCMIVIYFCNFKKNSFYHNLYLYFGVMSIIVKNEMMLSSILRDYLNNIKFLEFLMFFSKIAHFILLKIIFIRFKVTGLTVVALTVERYVVVKQKSLANQQLNRPKIIKMIMYVSFVWLFASSFALFKAYWIKSEYYEDGDTYACKHELSFITGSIYMIIKLTLAFVLPFALIIIFSCLLLLFLKNWSDSNLAIRGSQNNHKNRQRVLKRKSTIFVLSVVLSFLLTWLPLWVFQCLNFFTDHESIFIFACTNVTLILSYLGGVINPLLFIILTENFKQLCKNFIYKIY
jgi:hypothetical protein